MSNDAKKQTWANLLRSDQSEQQKEGPTAGERAAAAFIAGASFTAGWTAEQVHIAGQDFVSRVLLGEGYTPPAEQQHEQHHDKDEGLDR